MNLSLRQRRSILLAAVLLCAVYSVCAQAPAPFTLKAHTEEVHLSFRAEDMRGNSVEDLQQSDLKLLDNGKVPARILQFEHRTDLPIRIGLLFDTSPSMSGDPSGLIHMVNRLTGIAVQDPADRAMVMNFDFENKVLQSWTADPAKLADAESMLYGISRGRLGGTALYDALYTACRDSFTAELPEAGPAGNAILLFTDGSDNHSRALISDVIEECQAMDTAIYAFYFFGEESRSDDGQKNLRALAGLTGGRVFYQEHDKGIDVTAAALHLAHDLRDRYSLVYKPAKWKQDGSFHKIQLTAPNRPVIFNVRTGYYAAQ